jgi:type IV pilus assembly protein PilM
VISDFSIEAGYSDLAGALKKIRQSCAVEAVNIGLAGPATVVRCVQFPRMNKDEFKQALKFEAAKHIPFSVEEVNLDGCILKDNLAENKMWVLLAAARKETISQRLRIVEEAGFKVESISLDALALANAFNFSYPPEESPRQKAVALLNVGASISSLSILEGATLQLCRDLHIAGDTFTQKLADTLSLDFKSAEALKINPDKERMAKIISSAEAAVSSLGAEIRSSFDFYESQSASSVSKIFISAGAASLPGFKDTLANTLGIEVEAWDPFKKCSFADGLDSSRLKSLSGQLAVAVGLALKK